MNNFNYLKKNILYEYWNTLLRKNVSNIPNNKFLKKPYLENYIITLSTTFDDDKLKKKITTLIESNKITNEELFLFLNNNIEFNEIDKKNIELILFNDENVNEDYNKIGVDIIIYQIKYFRFYNTVVELLFDGNDEDNELYNFILIFIKNNKDEIKKYIKKNIKFNIFHNCIEELFKHFEDIINFFIKLNLFSITFEDDDILNLFLKNLFANWYNIYKKDILSNSVNEKIKDYVIKKSLISTILCLPNI